MKKNWFTKRKGKYSIGAVPSSWQGWTVFIILIIAIFRIVDNFSEHPIGAVLSFLFTYIFYEVVASLTLFSPQTGSEKPPRSSKDVLESWKGINLEFRHFGVGLLMLILIVLGGLAVAYIEAILVG